MPSFETTLQSISDRVWVVKRSLALAPAILVLAYGLSIGPKYDRYVLPAFDGHVYAAMAESPRVFTLAPWGYRILEPWIVHLLPASSAAVGFFGLNLVLLPAAIFATGWWLRRLGFSSLAAALAASAFAVSPPMRVLLDYQVLVDPLALLFLVLILDELREPDLLVLMALFAAAALTKETTLLFLTLLPLYLIRRAEVTRGLLDSAAVAAPALGLSVLLRLSWGNPNPPPNAFSVLDVTLGRLFTSGWALATTAVLSGLLLPALAGMIREKSTVLRIQGAALWTFTFGLILVNPYHYSVADLPRLSVFAWPALLPLALAGLGFERAPPSRHRPRSERLRTAGSVLTLLTCLAMVAATDRYQRAPFPAPPNPVSLTGRVRESLKTARDLDEAGTFTFDARSGRFATPVTESFNLTEGRRQRWFLYSGFGPDAAFGSRAPEFRGVAELLLPVFAPRTATLSFELKGPEGAQVAVSVAGRSIGTVTADGRPTTLAVPPDTLIRGDNVVSLRGPAGVTIRVIGWQVRLPPSGR